jgi:hypothetical protein
MRDAQLRTGLRNLNQDEAQAFRQGANDVNAQRGNQLGTLAALNHPELGPDGKFRECFRNILGTYKRNGVGQTVNRGDFWETLL